MLQVLFLAHAAIAIFMIFTRPLPEPGRARLVRAGAVAGMGAAGVLFFTRGTEASWGAARLDPASGAISAVAIFCAWALVATGVGGRGRWDVGALVGAAATGLALFATSRWIVPAMLFWVVVSLATAASVPRSRRSAAVWLVLALSDASFVGGSIALSLEAETWRLPAAVEGWFVVPLVAAILLRAGVVAGEGTWELSSGPQTALLPLVIASGFALVPSVSGGDEIYVALGILLIAITLAAWSVFSSSASTGLIGAWITSTMLAATWIDPAVLARAGVTALLGATVIALWPASAGRAHAERGLLLAAVPLTVGFGVIVGGAVVSFERARTATTVLESAPWSAFGALLPVALAAGVTLGAGLGRRREPERYEPAAVLATWGIVGIALLLGLSPRPDLAFSGGGSAATRGMLLYVVAALIAAGAARLVGAAPRATMEAVPPPIAPGPRLSGVPARAVALAAAVAAVPTLGAVASFTYHGLRTGFL